MIRKFSMVQGDLYPIFRTTLEIGDPPAPLDLTGRTVTFVMSDADGVLKINEEAVTIVGAATEGVVEYPWQDGDTDTVGMYRAQFVVYSGTVPMTVPSDDFIYIPILAALRLIEQPI